MQPWSFPYLLTFCLALIAGFYALGYFRLRKSSRHSIEVRQAVAFLGGLILIWIVGGSPLADIGHQLLLVHMIQHILLMAVAVPLLYLGAPARVLSNALRDGSVTRRFDPLREWHSLRLASRKIFHPLFCWFAAAITVIGWHVPALFELAMKSRALHDVQFASFLVAGLLFWWPVFEYRQTASTNSEWSVPLYLFLATLPCDALSAFLAFSGRVVYSPYLEQSGLRLSPLQDQEWAGVIMWVAVTFLYLAPAMAITVRLLSPAKSQTFDAAIALRTAQEPPLETSRAKVI